MVIDIINIHGIALDEPENHSPVRANCHGPKSFQLALKRMKTEARQVHISWRGRSIKTRENIAQMLRVLAIDAPLVVVLIKAFQPFVTDRPDHAPIVMRHVTRVKREALENQPLGA